ncbi:MAG: hypothetical protein V4734_11165, partial [Terriglobus sp.]
MLLMPDIHNDAYAGGMMMRTIAMLVCISVPMVAQVHGMDHAQLADVRELNGTVFHVQGVDLDAD